MAETQELNRATPCSNPRSKLRLSKRIDVHKEPTDLKALLSLVAKGTEIILAEGNKPVARLAPIGKRIAGLHSGAMRTTEDFNEPLPEEFRTI